MALPQSIDPTTLNISGKPALSTVAPTQITSAGATGTPNATIENVNRPVNPLLGALFGGLLGYATRENLGLGGAGTPTTGPTTPSGSGSTPSGGGGLPSGGGSSLTGGTGSVNSISFPAGTTQAQIDAIHGLENGQSKYQISGVNMSTGEVVATPNYNIGGTNLGTNTGNFGFEADTGTTTGGGATTGGDTTTEGDTTIGGETITTPTDKTPIANQYFQDSQGNIYDASGNLIYTSPKNQAPVTDDYITGGGYEPTPTTRPEYLQDSQGNVYDENGTLIYYNPSTAIPGTNDGGGGYDPNAPETEQYYEDSSGNIFDYAGNLVLEYGNGYYYEPDTGNFYDSNFDVVGDDFSAYQDFFGIPTLDTGGYDDYDFSDLFDYGNYTSGSTTYIKDGGSVRGGLATPLFRKGGKVRGYADGDLVTATPTSFMDQVVANQMPQSVSTYEDQPIAMETTSLQQPVVTTGSLTDTSSNPLTSNILGSILDTVLGTAKQNPIMTGAGLGALLTAALNSGSMAIPTNKGVDMAALGTLRPRTTTVGPARYVPYSEYGTPTTPYDYSQLYANLGVSPFGAGAGALSPSAVPTAPVSAQPTTAPITTPTAPTGGLPVVAPTTTTPTQPAQQYFQDANGNIYNANGDLVFDTTTGTTTPQANLTTAQSSMVAPSSTGTLAPTGEGDAYYSYGTPVTPSNILSSKKGGLANMAEGGSPHGNPNVPMSNNHNPNVPTVQGRQDYRQGAYVQGAGDGQSDDIPAMLADGEYVIDAETVAQLGNGSNKAGAKMLDTFRENIRAHKRSAPTSKIPPKSKSPLAYLKGAK